MIKMRRLFQGQFGVMDGAQFVEVVDDLNGTQSFCLEEGFVTIGWGVRDLNEIY